MLSANDEKRIEKLENRITYLEELGEVMPPEFEKWYENIPDGGVLCWFGEEAYKSICIVFPVTPNEDFNSANYKPLTKKEIQAFIDNAPEDL